MGETRRIRLGRIWRTIHLWLGVALFAFLAALGVSGSLLVWETPLDQLAHPGRYVVTAGFQAPSVYLASAEKVFGGAAHPSQLRMPRDAGLPVTVSGVSRGPHADSRPTLVAWIDPGTGRALDVGDPRWQLLGVIHQLHGNLLLAQNGRAVVGWLGCAMLCSSLTGLILWWPRGAWLRGLTWRRSPLTLSNLHHMVGFWLCLPLATLSLTGALIAFPNLVGAHLGGAAPKHDRAGQDAATPRAPSAHRHQADGPAGDHPAPSIGADGALAQAMRFEAGHLGLRLTALSPPSAGRHAWQVQLATSDGPPVALSVDERSGAVQASHTPIGPGGGDPVLALVRQIHEGSGPGLVWRIIVTVTGVAPALLGVTGVLVWLTRRRRTANVGGRAAAAVTQSS